MKKNEVVKDNKLFNTIIKTGKKIQNKYLYIYYKENDVLFPRFGIAVGTKIGNAVIRNKLKRQIRMILTNNKKIFSNNQDYIIIVKKACLNASYKEVENEVKNLEKW